MIDRGRLRDTEANLPVTRNYLWFITLTVSLQVQSLSLHRTWLIFLKSLRLIGLDPAGQATLCTSRPRPSSADQRPLLHLKPELSVDTNSMEVDYLLERQSTLIS